MYGCLQDLERHGLLPIEGECAPSCRIGGETSHLIVELRSWTIPVKFRILLREFGRRGRSYIVVGLRLRLGRFILEEEIDGGK